MKNTSNKSQVPTPNQIASYVAMHYGQQSDGRFKLMINGKRLLGTGIVYELEVCDSGKYKKGSFKITPGIDKSIQGPLQFYVVDSKTSEALHFIGDMETISIKSVKSSATDNEARTSKPCGIKPTVKASPTAKSGTATEVKKAMQLPFEMLVSKPENKHVLISAKKTSEKKRDLMEEMRLMNIAHNLGIPVQPKMRHLVFLTNESSQTIYRKVSAGAFPAPLKRGRGAFWPLEQVYQYLSNTWMGASNEGASE